MSQRGRVVAFVAVVLLAAVVATAYAVLESRQVRAERSAQPQVPTTEAAAVATGPRIVFRHSGLDSQYGLVAMVPLADPGGARAFTDASCDRVAAWDGGASCLVTEHGMLTTYEAQELGPDWQVRESYPLPGVPSRTRVSPDGTLVATTSFVTGHSYLSVGFSTATVVRELNGGHSWGNLEGFRLVLEGRESKPVDRNIWGVTFVDDRRFYATVATGGRTWLVEGDLSERTLTSVAEGAECPSTSPDGSRVAFKVDVAAGDATEWSLAVLDLTTGERTEIGDGPRGVDDQVAWLDDDTLMYGLPRADEPAVSDVWTVEARAGAQPQLLIEEAWSPSVVQ
jgi:hypothetical protein